MTLLNFSDSGEKPAGRRKPLRAILGIGALVGIVALGSTLAASINLNDSGPVEFGQGVTQTVACSGNDSIIVTPTSSFINADGAGDYYFTSVTLSSIPSSCIGADFSIAAYDDSGNIMRLSTGFCSLVGEKPVVNFDGSDSAPTEESSDEMFSEVIDADSSSFTLRWIDGMPNGCSSAALAEDVYRITIESRDGSGPVPSPSPTPYEYGNSESLGYLFGRNEPVGQTFLVPNSLATQLVSISGLRIKCDYTGGSTSDGLTMSLKIRSTPDSSGFLAESSPVNIAGSQCPNNMDEMSTQIITFVLASPLNVSPNQSLFFEISPVSPDHRIWLGHSFGDAYPQGDFYTVIDSLMTKTQDNWFATDAYFVLNLT